MGELTTIAHRLDPAQWVRDVLKVEPNRWQEQFLRAPRGASILALTARQCGKTTTAAWAMGHAAVFQPGSLSVVACPAQRQSAEAVRRVREVVTTAGAELVADNVYAIELKNGSRVLALPGSDDSVRGLTVDAWIVADEAARLTEDLIAALRPMRARRPHTRFAMLSTAWSRTDPFWTAWDGDDPTWIRIKATIDTAEPGQYDPAFLEQERLNLGEDAFKREYLGIPLGAQASPFTWDLFEYATQAHRPLVPMGAAFGPPITSAGAAFDHENPTTWFSFNPLIIAHDVGRSRDRSTAVVGGNSYFQPRLLGMVEFNELAQGLSGSARASALAVVDRRYQHNALIVADLSNDASYAEDLYETFGRRVIGLQISRSGEGMHPERRPVRDGVLPIYTIGRSHLLELYHTELQSRVVRMPNNPMSKRAYDQLMRLETEVRDTGIVYKCAPGQHDDLGISCAMLAWAARHPHLPAWIRTLQPRPRVQPQQISRLAWT
jgi:hypothetical protein